MDTSAFILTYQALFTQQIERALPDFGPPSPLTEAIGYALRNGGKRFRPLLVLAVASSITPSPQVEDAALAVEFFHTASLVADDLPCMDDEEMRREKPALHKVYDEATALLVSYALIAAGYERLRANAYRLEDPTRGLLAIEVASYCTGVAGATGGQYLDLYAPNHDTEKVWEALEKKTASLFELSFALGWLFGKGDLSLLPRVRTAACHFGRAFQIRDDFLDAEEDAARGALNYVNVVGKERASYILAEEEKAVRGLLEELQLATPQLLGCLKALF